MKTILAGLFTLLSCCVLLGAQGASIERNFATTNNPSTLTNIVAALGTGGVGIAAAAGTNVSLSTNASLVTFNAKTDTNIVNSLAAAQAALVRQTNVAVAGVTNAGTMSYSNAATFLGLLTNVFSTGQTNVAVEGVTNAGSMSYSNAPAFLGLVTNILGAGATQTNIALAGVTNAGTMGYSNVTPFLTLVTNIATSSGGSGQTNDAISIAGTGVAIVTNGPTGGKTTYTTSIADPLTLTTLNAGTANLTNVIGNGIGLTNLNWVLTNNSHYSGNNQFSGSNNYTGTLVVEGAMRVDDGSLIATNMTARTNASGGNALTTYGDITLNGNLVAGGTNTLTVGTRTLLHDSGHTLITNTATLTSSEWTGGSQKEWYNGGTTMTIDKTNGSITAKGSITATNGGLFGAPVTTTSSSSNSPSTLEFATAGWVRGLFNNGFIEYATSNIDNTATNPATLNQVVYQFWNGVIPQSSVRTWASGFITNNGYIGSVVTTNTFTSLSGPVDVNAYLGATTAGSLNNYFLTIHPEIYYSYDKTNWYGDYVANSQAITGNATNLYAWVISFPTITSTNATGFYVQRRLKIDTASTAGNVPTVYFMVGTNLVSGNSSASHISIAGQSAGLGTSPARSLGITIDGGGSAITLGTKGYLEVPCNCTILSGTILADVSGSIAIETWRTNSASMPPTRAGVLFTNYLTTAQASTDTTLANATSLSLTALDRIGFNVITNALSVTRATLQLRIQP